jgi:hypothetical protein
LLHAVLTDTLFVALTDRSNPPTVTANRVERASTKKRRKPLALFIVPAALVGLGLVLLFTLGGGTDAIPIIGDGPDDTVPEFDFATTKSTGISTVSEFDKVALAASAEQTGVEITPTIDDLFTNAFLDPSNWREGDYEEVFAAFAPDALPAAQQNVDTLTLGTTAGDVFEKVRPDRSSLQYRVLFDQDGNPDTAVVRFTFNATAKRTDGTFLAIVSSGQLFLQDLDGWKITAFDVARSDAEAEAPAGTGASAGSGATGHRDRRPPPAAAPR